MTPGMSDIHNNALDIEGVFYSIAGESITTDVLENVATTLSLFLNRHVNHGRMPDLADLRFGTSFC